MKRQWFSYLAALCLAAFAAPAAGGETPNYYGGNQQVSYDAMSETNARLAQLEAELAAIRNSGGNGGGCIESACNECCDTCPYFYFGYEATILKPYFSQAFWGPTNADYGYGNRFILGYEGGSGLGVRMRYWMFNEGFNVEDPIFFDAESIQLDMDVFDLEATLTERLCNWDLRVSGGVRYARWGQELEFDLDFIGIDLAGDFDVFFEGIGPTVAIEAVREFGCRGFYLVGNARASVLYGKVFARLYDDNIVVASTSIDGETTFVFENQLGVGWARELGRSELHLRLVWESQFWLNNTMSELFSTNLGFTGPTASLELRF